MFQKFCRLGLTLGALSSVFAAAPADGGGGSADDAVERFQQRAQRLTAMIERNSPAVSPAARRHLANLAAVVKSYAVTYSVPHPDPGEVARGADHLERLIDWLEAHPDGDAARWRVLAFVSDWDQTLQFALLHLPPGAEAWTLGWIEVSPEAMAAGQTAGTSLAPRLEPGKKLPLIVWLDGSGDPNPLRFLTAMIEPAQQRPMVESEVDGQEFLTLLPWRRGNLTGYIAGSGAGVLQALDEALRLAPVDSARVGLMGGSSGGAGSWRLALRYPDRWNAVCLEAPAAELVPKLDDWPVIANGTLLPWRFWDGGKDRPWLHRISARMRAALAGVGARVDHVVTPEAGHGPTPEAHRENLRWMLAQPPAETPSRFLYACRGMDATYRGFKPVWHRGVAMHPEFEDGFAQILTVDQGPEVLTITTEGARKVTLDPVRLGLPGASRRIVWNGEVVHDGPIGEKFLVFGKDDDPIKPMKGH